MDRLTNQALGAFLPPELNDFVQAHVLHPRSPFQGTVRQATAMINRFLGLLLPVVEPLFDRLVDAVNENQGTAGLLLVVAVVTAVLVVMSWIQRMMLWWTRVVFRLSGYAVLAVVAAVVWQRGLVASARDLVVLAGKLIGYAAVLKDVWMEEYDRYESQSTSVGRGRSGHR